MPPPSAGSSNSLPPRCSTPATRTARVGRANLRRRAVPIVTYGGTDAPLAATSVEVSPDETRFDAGGAQYRLRLPGRFNVSNALAAIGVARLLGIDDAASARGLDACSAWRDAWNASGRRGSTSSWTTRTRRTRSKTRCGRCAKRRPGGRAVVFGCGGERDRGKRPQMGAVAAQPRRPHLRDQRQSARRRSAERSPMRIVAGIGGARTRARARSAARDRTRDREARPGDVVLVAGKGSRSATRSSAIA